MGRRRLPALISHCNQSSVLAVDGVQQQWADEVYLQMEHKQMEKCNKQNVHLNCNLHAIKKLIVWLTQLKKLKAWQL